MNILIIKLFVMCIFCCPILFNIYQLGFYRKSYCASTSDIAARVFAFFVGVYLVFWINER